MTRVRYHTSIVWQRTYLGPTHGSSVQALSDGFTFSGGTNGTGYVFRTDSAGEVLWRNELEILDFDFEARRLADGEYAVVAHAGPHPSLLKMNESGEFIWETVFGENDFSFVSSFEVLNDGGYVAAGVTYTGRNRDLFVARLSPTGVGRFVRGDSNDDGLTNLADAVFSLGRLFGGAGDESDCLQAADVDDDGEINLTDPVFLLHHLFQAGPPRPRPSRAVASTPPWTPWAARERDRAAHRDDERLTPPTSGDRSHATRNSIKASFSRIQYLHECSTIRYGSRSRARPRLSGSGHSHPS